MILYNLNLQDPKEGSQHEKSSKAFNNLLVIHEERTSYWLKR